MSMDPNIAPLWAEEHSAAQRKLLDAAVAAFARRGYGGTATRDIARAAGMSPAAMYIYYPSKADLLFAMCHAGHLAVSRTVERAVEAAGDDPHDRTRAFIWSFVAWHGEYHEAARIAQYELHALPVGQLSTIAELRRSIENALCAEVAAALAADGRADDPHDVVRALLSLGIDVARWYTTRHRHAPWELADIYADLGMRMVSNGGSSTPASRGDQRDTVSS